MSLLVLIPGQLMVNKVSESRSVSEIIRYAYLSDNTTTLLHLSRGRLKHNTHRGRGKKQEGSGSLNGRRQFVVKFDAAVLF
ncbi:hypothetical protein ILYODFUR_014115 [Ilyodon furcidens]|uniref:Uncharacterized protein n=1 Tax=Ilyodon furcidens TaxID=33524 RepID=A0ABV0T9M9_9TELE